MAHLSVKINGLVFEVEGELSSIDEIGSINVNGETIQVGLFSDRSTAAGLSGEAVWGVVDGRPYEIQLDPEASWLMSGGEAYLLEIRDLEARVARPFSGDGRIKAPIPGQISRVFVEPGQQVEPGQPILILEAMKMQNEICATRAGSVKLLNVAPGQGVLLNDVLAEIE
jgi:biotin carboxyl carrier protein